MFPVKCKDLLPVDHLVIKSVSVRGKLGPLTVWVSNEEPNPQNGRNQVRLNPAFWTKVYDKVHTPSKREYKELVLDKSIRLKPGETRVIYIHSTLPGDEAIVYDNSYYGVTSKRYDDDKLSILTGRAHVSTQVFGQEPIWGWGNAWRDRREFVGRLEYGTVYKLWNPQFQPKFGGLFQNCTRCLFMCQRRWESPFSILPDECIHYILNMCRWDWFDDDMDTMRRRRQREKARIQASSTSASVPMVMNAKNEDGDYEMEEEDNQHDDNNDEEVDSEDEEWSDDEDQYHNASIQSFAYHDVDSDEEEDDEESLIAAETSRRDWVRRQFARIHVLRALAAMEDGSGGFDVEY